MSAADIYNGRLEEPTHLLDGDDVQLFFLDRTPFSDHEFVRSAPMLPVNERDKGPASFSILL